MKLTREKKSKFYRDRLTKQRYSFSFQFLIESMEFFSVVTFLCALICLIIHWLEVVVFIFYSFEYFDSLPHSNASIFQQHSPVADEYTYSFLWYSIQFVTVSLRHCTWYSKQLSYTLPGDSYFVIHISLDCVSAQMSAPVERIKQKCHELNCSTLLRRKPWFVESK